MDVPLGIGGGCEIGGGAGGLGGGDTMSGPQVHMPAGATRASFAQSGIHQTSQHQLMLLQIQSMHVLSSHPGVLCGWQHEAIGGGGLSKIVPAPSAAAAASCTTVNIAITWIAQWRAIEDRCMASLHVPSGVRVALHKIRVHALSVCSSGLALLLVRVQAGLAPLAWRVVSGEALMLVAVLVTRFVLSDIFFGPISALLLFDSLARVSVIPH